MTGLNRGAGVPVGPILGALWLWHTLYPTAAQPAATEQVGIATEVDGSCPNLSFELDGILTVTTDTATDFRGLLCDDLRVGLRLEIEGFQQTNGQVAALEVELNYEGPVVGVSGSCPSLRFFVRGTEITTSSETDFDGLSCTDVQNDLLVELEGTLQSDGTIVASEVERASDDVDDVDDDDTDDNPDDDR